MIKFGKSSIVQFIILIALMLSPFSLMAAPGHGKNKPKLTLLDCFDLARKYSEVVKISQKEIEIAKTRYLQALGQVIPVLTFKGSELLQDSGSVGSDSVSQTFTQFSRPTARFNIQQNLFRGLREITAIRLSKVDRRRARLAQQDVERLLFQDVAVAFYTIAIVERDIQTQEMIIRVIRQRIKELKERIQLGKSREGELTQEQSLLALNLADLERRKGERQIAYEMMSFLTGVSPMPQINWKSPLPNTQKKLDYYLSHVSRRPDYRAAGESVKLAKGEAKITLSDLLPAIEAEANFYPYRTGFQSTIVWDAEFRLDVPMVNITDIGRYKESKLRAKQAQMQQEQVRREAVDETKKAFEDFHSSRNQLKKYRQAVSLAKKNFDLQSEDFKIGRATNLEVLTAQRTWLDSLEQRNRAETQSWLNWTLLQTVSGVLP